MPLATAQALQQQVTNLKHLLAEETAERMRWMRFNDELRAKLDDSTKDLNQVSNVAAGLIEELEAERLKWFQECEKLRTELAAERKVNAAQAEGWRVDQERMAELERQLRRYEDQRMDDTTGAVVKLGD